MKDNMIKLFEKENHVLSKAEEVILRADSCVDKALYHELAEEYGVLLKQVMRLVKLSDIMQLELKVMSEKLETISRVDALTGLYNRRYFNETSQREWKNAFRMGTPLAVLMVDIDDFKRYNDYYGHLQGDDCLVAVAQCIQRAVKRPRDMVARFGGEEFVVMLPETNLAGARFVAEEVLSQVRALGLEHQESSKGFVTVSIGAASIMPDGSVSLVDFLNMVDSAMYMAKSAGKDQMCTYEGKN